MYLALLVLSVFAFASEPEAPEKLLQRAISEHQTGNTAAAIRDYRSYLKLRPDAVDARSNLGAALASTGNYTEAISEYQEALKGSPKNPRIWLNLSLAFYKSGQISRAATELEALHAVQPGNKQVVLVLADCWLRMGEDNKVIGLLTPVEKQDEKDLAVAYMLGTALIRSKQLERGQQMIDRILRNGDSAEARLLMGTAKLNALEFNEAIADFQKAVELNPELPDVYTYLGRAHLEVEDQAAARADFEKELERNPNDFDSNLHLAVLLKEAQEFDRARRLLDRALLVRPGDLATLYQVASLDIAQDEFEKARALLERIVKEAPEFREAHISLATVYYRLKRKSDGDRERAIVQKLKPATENH
jgi:tetratricopeptide (TPR) repeat protein